MDTVDEGGGAKGTVEGNVLAVLHGMKPGSASSGTSAQHTWSTCGGSDLQGQRGLAGSLTDYHDYGSGLAGCLTDCHDYGSRVQTTQV